VRRASSDTIIVAEGFSCREQIAQETERHALHPAELLQMALHASSHDPGIEFPEYAIVHGRERDVQHSILRAAAVLAGITAAGLLLWKQLRR
jgi:hypothetical protein